MKKRRIIFVLIAGIILIFSSGGCGEKSKTKEKQNANSKSEITPEQNVITHEIKMMPKLPKENTLKVTNSSKWVKILSYHIVMPEAEIKRNSIVRFTKASDLALVTPLESFEKQLEYISKNFKVVKFSDFAKRLETKEEYDRNAVILSFDGADECFYKYTYPAMKKYSMPSVLFLYVNSVKLDKTAMKWETIKKLHEEGLVEIESHTITHPHLGRRINGESDEKYRARVRFELSESKKIVEEKLIKKVYYFAYPYGSYNSEVIEMLKETGYKAAVTVQWDRNTVNSNPFTLKRRTVVGTFNMKKFIEIFDSNASQDNREFAD